jgi:surfeit locus 1 family protein
LVISLSVLFVNLGFWQLRRFEERRLQNTIWQSRLAAEPLPIEDALSGAGGDLASLEYRHVLARGTFAQSDEVFVRSQVMEGIAGFHIITPLVLSDGTALLVNRGWIPLEIGEAGPPASAAPPPSGTIEIGGLIRLTQVRRSIGPIDPDEGVLKVVARVDIDRLAQQIPFGLVPVYVVEQGGPSSAFPRLVEPPNVTDEGPHLSYAIQWFAFALIGAVGYLFLLRRARARNSIDVEGETLDNLG